ncbi:MAG: divalent-cation tolerance protein CutA [Verrucomicrobiota bacterium]
MLLVAWTTVTSAADADRLAADAVARGYAACVQVEGPVTSHYRWQGTPERTAEFRLMFKFLPDQQPALEQWLHTVHPYAVPEWTVVRVEQVGEKYLSWARAEANS